ncbi:MAG: spermidine/putrescine ABC transporter substrate-binding protein [Brockia lithotrophica]|nr:spermidine/putrescine ABC transporter substrate-binding protein [Brockia lithotrophica]
MRTLVRFFVFVGILLFLAFSARAAVTAKYRAYGENVLHVYNWGDYVDPALLERFQEETGIRVVYETFDSNEEMLAKLRQGGTSYDIAVPSDYAIQRLIREGLLLPIDHSRLPNLRHIDPRFLDLPFDPGNRYSVPYFWGTLGIAYRPDRVPIEIQSWRDLWSPELRGQVLLVDGPREVVGIGLQALGYSLNDSDPAHLEEAKALLDSLVPNVKAIVGDEIRVLLAQDEASVGVIWSGDAKSVLEHNESFEYVIPKEGSNIWFDNFVIPKTARNVEGAYKFIDFFLDPEIAAQNAEYVGFATPNRGAFALLPEEVTSDERFYPPEDVLRRLEVYLDLGRDAVARYNELFLEFKMHRK